jgi:aminopeptidase N
MERDRQRVIAYSKRNFAPIIDTTITNYNRLLSTNSYQKASWVLHMLREKLGDEVFFAGLQKYYHDFRNSTALTHDFRKAMEDVSGENLKPFFNEWLRQPGQPQITVSIKQKAENKVRFNIKQIQPGTFFTFPLELEIHYKNGDTELKTITIKDRETVYATSAKGKIETIIPDPGVKLLFELIQ